MDGSQRKYIASPFYVGGRIMIRYSILYHFWMIYQAHVYFAARISFIYYRPYFPNEFNFDMAISCWMAQFLIREPKTSYKM